MLCAVLGLRDGGAPPLPGSVLGSPPRTSRPPWDCKQVAGRRGDRVAHFKGPFRPKSHWGSELCLAPGSKKFPVGPLAGWQGLTLGQGRV